MFPKLKNNEKFLKDYNIFKSEIEKLTNQRVRQKCQHLLSKFLEEAKLIDEAHSTYNNGYINPRASKDHIDKMVSIRKELSNIIKTSRVK